MPRTKKYIADKIGIADVYDDTILPETKKHFYCMPVTYKDRGNLAEDLIVCSDLDEYIEGLEGIRSASPECLKQLKEISRQMGKRDCSYIRIIEA